MIVAIQARGVTKLQDIADELDLIENPTHGAASCQTSIACILSRVARPGFARRSKDRISSRSGF